MINTDITLLLTLSLLLWISPYIAKNLRIPLPATEIILGSLAAYIGLIRENEAFDLIAEVGFLYLMFLAGMEVDIKQLRNSSRATVKRSVLFLILMTLFCIASGAALDLHAIVLVSMPLISIGLLASLSKIYGKTPWLNTAFTVGILGEILSITVLTVFDAATAARSSDELIHKLLYLALFVVSIFFLYRMLRLLFWWFPELKRILVPKFDTSDQDIRLSMALFFILISVMLYLDLELALGAFIAGMALSIFFRHEHRLEERISGMGFGLLIPIFFIHVGSSFDLEALPIEGVASGALLITGIMIGGRLLGAYVFKRSIGSRHALSVGFALSMPLTLLIAVATIGYEAQMLDILNYYRLILASIFETLIGMSAIAFLNLRDQRRQSL